MRRLSFQGYTFGIVAVEKREYEVVEGNGGVTESLNTLAYVVFRELT